jgi:hypothetical protein
LIEAKHLDYKMIDAIFGSIKILKASQDLEIGRPSHPLSELFGQNINIKHTRSVKVP